MSYETLAWAKAQRTGNPTRKAVLMALAEYADENHSCFPGQDRLAHDLEVSSSTVKRSIRDLEDGGHITTTPRYADGRKVSNRYQLQVGVNMTPSTDPVGVKPTTSRGHQVTSEEPVSEEPEPSSPPSVAGGGSYAADFEAVWQGYPRKLSKKSALKAYAARRREGVSADTLALACSRYASSVVGKLPEHIKHGATFFGPNEHWKDYLPPEDGGIDERPADGGPASPAAPWSVEDQYGKLVIE